MGKVQGCSMEMDRGGVVCRADDGVLCWLVHVHDCVMERIDIMTKPQTDRFFKLMHGKTVIAYHHDKMEAKEDLRCRLAECPEMGHIKLCRGPDHWKGETDVV